MTDLSDRNRRMWELVTYLTYSGMPYNPPLSNWRELEQREPKTCAALAEYLELKAEEESENEQ